MKKLVLLMFATALFAHDFEEDSLSPKVREFLKAETAAARTKLAGFSDDELQQVVQTFKKSLSKPEQRLFWLSEEYYRRNAERVAAERIRYLFAAVIAALAIITSFSILTYMRQKK